MDVNGNWMFSEDPSTDIQFPVPILASKGNRGDEL
jgi:hypothetical protein